MLSIDPVLEGEKRQDEVKKEVEDQNNSMMSIDGITQRAAFVPLLFLANTIIGLFLLMISGSIILYQMIFLVLVLFAPVPLLMALVPRWQHTAFDWLMKVIHAQLMKIAIALLLTILFGISAILYRATENSDLGYLGMMIIQIICFVGVWAKRKELFNMVTTATNNVQSSTGASLQSYQRKFRQAKSVIRNGQNLMDKTNNKGRIRNQPLAQRYNDLHGQNKLENRQRYSQGTKEGLMAAAGTVGASAIMDRNGLDSNQDFHEKMKNRTVDGNATVDLEKLADRKTENDPKTEKGNVTSIDNLRQKRLKEKQNLFNVPLVDRNPLKDPSQEIASAMERSEMGDAELTDRSKSERNINLINQHNHEDRINDHQMNQLTERRVIDRNIEREVSEEITNREQNKNHKIKRNIIQNEENERSISNVTERKNSVNEIKRESFNQSSKHEKNVTTTNREGGNKSDR